MHNAMYFQNIVSSFTIDDLYLINCLYMKIQHWVILHYQSQA